MFQLATPQTMKLLCSNEKTITKDKNGDNVSQLEVTALVLVCKNIFNNAYRNDSKVLYTLTLNKLIGSLIDILPSAFTFLETFNPDFLHQK